MYEAGIYMLINSCYVGILPCTEDTESASRARRLRVDLTLYHGLTHMILSHARSRVFHLPALRAQSPPNKFLGLYDRFVQKYCFVREIHQTFGQEMEAQGQAPYSVSLLIAILLVSAQGEGMILPS